MKPWISFVSHAFAIATSFVALSVAPVLLYGALALTRAWQTSDFGAPSSLLAVPLLSALGAGAFSLCVAPLLSVMAQKQMRRFAWNAPMFPLLLACFGTVALSIASGAFGLKLSSSVVLGAGLALGAAFSSYWFPLRWMQKMLPRFDARCGEMRTRLGNRTGAQPVSLS